MNKHQITIALLTIFLPVFSNSISLVAQEKCLDSDQVKVAAVQLTGYDKSVIPGLEIDLVGKVIPNIERAARDSAQLVVFPEYVMGRIKIPGKQD